MKVASCLNLLFILPLTLLSLATNGSNGLPRFQRLGSLENYRRVLHQPFFPSASTPPLAAEPPPKSSQIPDPDEPFFPGTPNGRNPDQAQNSPPPPSLPSTQVPIATQASSSTKKVAVAISVGIVTLGMLSALAFFLYKYKIKHSIESEKLVGRNSQQFSEDSRTAPSSDLLYLGTMEPISSTNHHQPRRGGNWDENGGNGSSPYHKLSSLRSQSENHHASPELQPLPPLNRAPLGSFPPNISYEAPYRTSPSVMSSEESFYSPQNSVTGYSERSNSQFYSTSFPRRSSPRSRLSVSSSPDVSKVLTPNPPPPPPPLPPKRKSKFPVPPPPPPPTSGVPGNLRSLQRDDSSTPVPILPKPKPTVPSRKSAIHAEVSKEVSQGGKSSVERYDEVEDAADGARPKLKPLHWDKVRASSDRAMVWDQLNAGSFHLNEDMIETLFGCNPQNLVQNESSRRPVPPHVRHENQVLDPKKSQNIAILLRALNVTRDEVSEALLDGNSESLGAELLETLVKMAPTKEEELKLKNYTGDLSKLGSAERFLKTVLDIPFAFKRVDAMLYRANFEAEINYLRTSFEILEVACEELKSSRLFLKLLEAVLRTGNRMNVGTNRGDARAFKLDTLLKLVDIKGTDGKTTLLHFVVHEIIRSEGAHFDHAPDKVLPKVKEDSLKKQGLKVVAGLSRELENVKKAAGMDSDVLSSYLLKLETGLEKVKLVFQYEKSNIEGKFFESMTLFLNEAKEEILQVKVEEKKTLSRVKEVTEYFHGDTSKEEPHPFRIFMVVRDFLSVLDQVCKEVGNLQDRTLVGSARSFRIPTSTSLPVLNRFNVIEEGSSDSGTFTP